MDKYHDGDINRSKRSWVNKYLNEQIEEKKNPLSLFFSLSLSRKSKQIAIEIVKAKLVFPE